MSRRPAVRPGPLTRDEYLARWSALHGEVAPAGLIGGWLRLIHRMARTPARLGVPPGAVTLTGLALAGLALWPAAASGRWPLVAVVLIVGSAVLDSVDGAVAVLTDRVTRSGAVLDQACDRLSDLCFIGALRLAGAPAGWCLAGAVLALLHEQVRAGARVAGMSDVGVITVSERPTRVIVTTAFLLGAGLYPATAGSWATAGALTWTLAGAVGLLQLARTVHRRLG